MALADALVGDPTAIPNDVRLSLGLLAPVYEHSRYPSGSVDEPIPVEAIDADVARDAIEAARRVMKWARQFLEKPPGKPTSGKA